MATATGKLLTQDEKNLCEVIAKLNIRLISQRAKALLFVDQGNTQAKSAELSSLSIGQLRYLLVLFKEKGINLFPAHLLPQKEETTAPTPEKADEPTAPVEKELNAKEEENKTKMKIKKTKKEKKADKKPAKLKKKKKGKKKDKDKKVKKKGSSKSKKKSKKGKKK